MKITRLNFTEDQIDSLKKNGKSLDMIGDFPSKDITLISNSVEVKSTSIFFVQKDASFFVIYLGGVELAVKAEEGGSNEKIILRRNQGLIIKSEGIDTQILTLSTNNNPYSYIFGELGSISNNPSILKNRGNIQSTPSTEPIEEEFWSKFNYPRMSNYEKPGMQAYLSQILQTCGCNLFPLFPRKIINSKNVKSDNPYLLESNSVEGLIISYHIIGIEGESIVKFRDEEVPLKEGEILNVFGSNKVSTMNYEFELLNLTENSKFDVFYRKLKTNV